ncbi:unnamed protein product [Dibothriocephalus latus]|uniref:Uncharacterized protein n=1 Tax=Dibothriocephalus latus TaxID=60516 RepID=A0A3P7P3D9_DIBLA|nr:unnamed protein product [Dibothriocephalus latus]
MGTMGDEETSISVEENMRMKGWNQLKTIAFIDFPGTASDPRVFPREIRNTAELVLVENADDPVHGKCPSGRAGL